MGCLALPALSQASCAKILAQSTRTAPPPLCAGQQRRRVAAKAGVSNWSMAVQAAASTAPLLCRAAPAHDGPPLCCEQIGPPPPLPRAAPQPLESAVGKREMLLPLCRCPCIPTQRGRSTLNCAQLRIKLARAVTSALSPVRVRPGQNNVRGARGSVAQVAC